MKETNVLKIDDVELPVCNANAVVASAWGKISAVYIVRKDV